MALPVANPGLHFIYSLDLNQSPFSVLRYCWLGSRKGVRPVKTEWWGAGVVICLVTNRQTHRPCHSCEEPGLLKGGVVGPAGVGRWNNRQSRAGQARHGVSAVMLLLHCQQLSCRYSSCVYFHRRFSITSVPRPAAWLLHALSPHTVVLSSGSEQLTMYTMYHKKGTAYICL